MLFGVKNLVLGESKVVGVFCVQTGFVRLGYLEPESELDKEVVWMMSSYVIFTWDNIFVRNAEVKSEQFFSFLTFKYKENQNFSRFKLKFIYGIS